MGAGKAYRKDVLRTIARSRKRFVSLLVITALGVTMLAGLKVACIDLLSSADTFFDDQGLYDVSVVSTMGLTDDDVAALAAVDGVEVAEGAYTEAAFTPVDGKRASVDVKALSERGLNVPYMVEGRLPERADEIVVTEGYLQNTGKRLGDTVAFEGEAPEEENAATGSEDADVDGEDAGSGSRDAAADVADEGSEEVADGGELFERREYTITGSVIDPTNVNNTNGHAAFRGTATADYAFFVTPEAVVGDTYTAVYLRLAGARDVECYSQAYEDRVAEVVKRVEGIKEAREQARTEAIKADALATIEDAEREAQEQFAEADTQLADAQAEIDANRQTIADSRAQLASQEGSAADQLAAAQRQIDDGYAQLEAGAAELEASAAQLADGQRQLDDGRSQLSAAQDDANRQLAEQRAALEAAGAPAEQLAQLEAQQQASDAAFAEQFAGLDAQQAQMDAGGQQLEDGRAEIERNRAQLDAGAAELAAQRADAQRQIADGKSQIADGAAQLEDGQAELDEQRATYESERADAEQKLADARAEVEDIGDAQWYIQDRSSLGSYTSIESDASSIEAVGTAFPIVFFIVAILISLTTVTRMVEEERGLIGTYKAIGLRNREILAKYVVYALAACLIGGIVGDVLGFVALPLFVFSIFDTLYVLPGYTLSFDLLYGLGGIALFTVGIVGSAVVACRAELVQTPATLMRPKAPRAGSRIFLERIGFLWKRLTFLNKVTARNLFRYKKRLFMTVAGIMGCTALVLCGFAIKDSVTALGPAQYGHISAYDLMVVASTDGYGDLVDDLRADGEVSDLIEARIDSATIEGTKGEDSVQLVVVPRGGSLESYVTLEDATGAAVELGDDDVLVTRNAANVLGFGEGDTVVLQDSALAQGDAVVDRIVENYLGNTVFMGQGAYERLFGAYVPNGVFAHLDDSVADQGVFADELAQRTGVLSVTSTQRLGQDFSSAFALVNSVVYVIIAMAAALAFTVLFTLSTTNISERERELATIKVLGFRAPEVHRYVNKETLILTAFGIALGLPLGHALGGLLTSALNMPSIYFAVHIDPLSYVLAAVLSFAFALLVDALTNRTLDRINMVEALKSVE